MLWLRVKLILLARKISKSGILGRIPRQTLEAYYRLRSEVYSGSAHECPCCGRAFRAFIRSGKNRKCPRCNSYQRHRLLALFLKNKTDIFSEGLKVLHVAPEHGLQSQLKSFHGPNYISIDVDAPFAELKMDVTELQFEDNSFDVILCYHVLEKVPDDRKAISEFFRVLKPGGWGIIQVPLEPDLPVTVEDPTVSSFEARHKLYGEWDDVRLYGRDYYQRLEEAGFELRISDYCEELDNETIARNVLRKDNGRLPAEICHVVKPKIR
jgi:SAM-dependent methyltransferase